jgi:hypothetical protein
MPSQAQSLINGTLTIRAKTRPSREMGARAALRSCTEADAQRKTTANRNGCAGRHLRTHSTAEADAQRKRQEDAN